MTSCPSFVRITHMIQSWISLMAFPKCVSTQLDVPGGELVLHSTKSGYLARNHRGTTFDAVYLHICVVFFTTTTICSLHIACVISIGSPSWFKTEIFPVLRRNLKPPWICIFTSTVMKVFERLLKKHICSSIPASLDPLQFAYRPNRSTDGAIFQVLHSSLTHIDSKNGNYVRLLSIDYSSAFNTIVPTKLAVKLSDLGLNTSLCDWIQDFLTGRPQVVKVGQFTSNSITLNIGAPQGCVLSPLLYSLYTHDCVSSHSSTSIIKFADDTVVLGLISNNDETAYLGEVERLTSWCQDNCLSLNVSKTKELIVDFRKRQQRP